MAGGPKGMSWLERGTSLFLAFATMFTCVFGLIAAAVTIRADVDDLKKYKTEAKVDMDSVKSSVAELKTTAEVVKTDVKWLVNNEKQRENRR